MRIGIDISPVLYGTGVSVYTKNLLVALLAIDKSNEYIITGGSLRRKDELDDYVGTLKGNLVSKVNYISPEIANIIFNQIHIIPIDIFTGHMDVFHSSDWTQPKSKAFKVTTVHDLFPLRYPKLVHPKIVNTHELRMRWVVSEIDAVIVPSQATKEDVRLMGVNSNKIHVIPEALKPEFKRVPDQRVLQVKKKFGIKREYFLSVGIGERKNTTRTIQAWQEYKDDFELILVGRNQEELDLGNAKHLDFVSTSDLMALYSGASLFLYPSLYEGFGLPILEAFACRCPVLTSNISSLPEVAGDACVLVNPNSIDDIVHGIKSAIRTSKTLIRKGSVRVGEFSWHKTAKQTLDVYNLSK